MKNLKTGLLAALLLLTVPFHAIADEEGSLNEEPKAWVVDKNVSVLSFTGTQTGKSFSGEFSDFEAMIILDPDNLDAASITVTVQTGSAKTGDRQRDSALPGKDWFNEKSFPSAVFEATNVIKAPDDSFVARGTLSLRGVSKEIDLPFSLQIEDGTAFAEGSVQLIRSDFGVGQGEFSSGKWVGLEVDVSFMIKAIHP